MQISVNYLLSRIFTKTFAIIVSNIIICIIHAFIKIYYEISRSIFFHEVPEDYEGFIEAKKKYIAELKEYIFSRVAMNHFKATEANTAYLK